MSKKKKNQLPSGNVRVRVYVGTDADGKKIYRSFTAATSTQAKAMAAEWKTECKAKVENISILDTVKEFIEINQSRLSPTTVKTYTGYLKYIEACPICNIRLRDLTNSDVQRFLNTLSLSVSAKTVKNVYLVLKPAVELKRDDFRFRVVLPAVERAEKHLPSTAISRQHLMHAKQQSSG